MEIYFVLVIEAEFPGQGASRVQFWWDPSYAKNGHPLVMCSHGLFCVWGRDRDLWHVFLFLQGH